MDLSSNLLFYVNASSDLVFPQLSFFDISDQTWEDTSLTLGFFNLPFDEMAPALYQFAASKNALRQIPDFVSQHKTLEKLYMSDNLITEILPGTFDGAEELWTVNLDRKEGSHNDSTENTGVPPMRAF